MSYLNIQSRKGQKINSASNENNNTNTNHRVSLPINPDLINYIQK